MVYTKYYETMLYNTDAIYIVNNGRRDPPVVYKSHQ